MCRYDKVVIGVVTLLLASQVAMGSGIDVGFESPDYSLGDLEGQSGGGIAWSNYVLGGPSASVVTSGYNSAQAGLWDVIALNSQSVGDDMLGAFDNGQAPVFSLSGMSYAHLNPNASDPRSLHFFVSDVDFYGAGLIWSENGNMGHWTSGWGNTTTTTPIIYDQWVSFEIQVNYTLNQATYFYDGSQIAQTALTGTGSGYADQLDIWLESPPLVNSPDAGDYMLFDNIVITPEPACLALLALGSMAVLRRRRRCS